MSIPRAYWKFFLVDAPSGLCFKEAGIGNIIKLSVSSGINCALTHSPVGWQDMQISFGMHAHYWGLARTFTVPMKFVFDGARIIRKQLYSGRGIEAPIIFIALKWDSDKDVFRLYYNGLLDLSKVDDQVSEGITVNVMEGGAVGMLRAYENTIVELPCDGSIPENVKINADGREFSDVFHYQITPGITSPFVGPVPLSAVFTSNEGDNIGVIHQDPFMEATGQTGYYQKSANFVFSAEEPTTVKLKGSIIVKSDWRVSSTAFYMFTATSKTQNLGGGDPLNVHQHLSNAIGLITPKVNADGTFDSTASQIFINGQQLFSFNATINLDANEKLFILYYNNFTDKPIQIVAGSFTLSFNSRYRASRVWGIQAYNVGKLLVQKINALSSNFLQTFNFGFDSELLKSKLNFVITSGDAARASTDPNYYQYSNPATINPTNPSNQDFNQFSSIGPTIKASIAGLFDGLNPVLNAALGVQKLPGEEESIFFEDKRYVLDPSVITLSLKKVANLRISIALDYYFNWLKIGYENQSYDEKSGKYEYNDLVQFQAPVKTINKVLELVSKWRADTYGFEFKRWNTQGGKSTTYNDGDNSVFIINVDTNSSVPDFYEASFISEIPDASSNVNTDQKLIVNKNHQPIYLDFLDGDYFTSTNDFAIFIFNQPSPATAATSTIAFHLLLNGLEGDSATVRMWVNGFQVKSWAKSISAVNTPFDVSDSFARAWAFGDCIYFTIDTIRTCTVSISDFSIIIGAGYWEAQATGTEEVAAGSTQQLVTLPIIAATNVVVGGQPIPVVSYGFQYLTFLSSIGNKNFDWQFILSGYTQGGTSNQTSFSVWYNGVIIGTITHNSTVVITQFNPTNAIDLSGNITFGLYDRLWITGSAQNMSSWVSYVDFLFNSTSIRAYNLNRPSVTGKSDNSAYSNISGIPNPSSAFNIPELTPAAMRIANNSLLASTLFNLAPGALKFQTADRNAFLSATLNGVTITERADVDIHDLGDPLFLPFILEFDTEVPINFADLLNLAAKGHIEVPYNNKLFYGFPLQVTSKPAFRESQTWKLLCSPKTNLADLQDLTWTGLVPLNFMDVSIPIVCPIHFIPLNYKKGADGIYHFMTMDEDWYVNRIKKYVDQSNFYQPRQNNEPIPLQIRTFGLDPVSVQRLDCNGVPSGSPFFLSVITTDAISSDEKLYQGEVPVDGLQGIFYYLFTQGVGEGQAVWISEPIFFKDDWGDETIRFDYSNTENILSTVFTGTYRPSLRVFGQINDYMPKSKYTTFVNQPQDIDILDGIPYDTYKLVVGRGSGMPEYIMRKINFIMSKLDTVFIEGNQYTREVGSDWEPLRFPGQPKFFMTLEIRRAENIEAVTLNTEGQLDSDMLGGYTLDAGAFGFTDPGGGQYLIQVGNS